MTARITSSRSRAALAAIITLSAVTVAVLGADSRGPSLGPGEYQVDGRIYGMPEARVFTEEVAHRRDHAEHHGDESLT